GLRRRTSVRPTVASRSPPRWRHERLRSKDIPAHPLARTLAPDRRLQNRCSLAAVAPALLHRWALPARESPGRSRCSDETRAEFFVPGHQAISHRTLRLYPDRLLAELLGTA